MEIVEAGFVIVVVATVTKRIKIGEGGAGGLFVDEVIAAAVEDAGQLAPRVVGVFARLAADCDLRKLAAVLPR